MKIDEAKRHLIACRVEIDSAADSNTAEALKLTESDPALAGWFQQQQAFHSRIRRSIRKLPVPPELKERILREAAAPRPAWGRRELFLMAAALVSLLAGVFHFLIPSGEQSTVAAFQARMVGFALREYRMDIRTNDLAQVRRFLAAQNAPANFMLTRGLESVPVAGGGRLSWLGNPVGMICFSIPEDEIAFLFVVPVNAVKDGGVPGSLPDIGSVKRLMTATWNRDGRLYLLAARATREEIETLSSP